MRLMFHALILATLLLAAGCPKGGKDAAATARRAPAAGAPAAAADATASSAQTPAPASPRLEEMEGNKVLTPDAPGQAEGTAAPEQQEQVKAALLAALPARKLTFDAASGKITGPAPWDKGVGMDWAVNRIALKLAAGPGFAPDAMQTYCEAYLDEMQKMLMRVQDRPKPGKLPPPDTKHGQAGETIETLKNQTPPKFTPAKAIQGDWRSLREVNEGYTLQINHSDLYHETMAFRKDGTMTWVVFRGGVVLSSDDYTWKYNAAKGELTISFPQGTVYQTLTVFSADTDPGNLYIKTPNVDRLKVFGKDTAPAPAQ